MICIMVHSYLEEPSVPSESILKCTDSDTETLTCIPSLKCQVLSAPWRTMNHFSHVFTMLGSLHWFFNRCAPTGAPHRVGCSVPQDEDESDESEDTDDDLTDGDEEPTTWPRTHCFNRGTLVLYGYRML